MAHGYLIHYFIYSISMPVLFVSLCLVLPPFFIFNKLFMIKRFIFSESMKDKVVLITGASSGIGEQMAYEYAKKGASLVIVARRQIQLGEVAKRARGLGSPDVLPICADVSNVKECERFVDEAMNHFGRLDHLVNNAGIACAFAIEDATDITKFAPVMDVNFWGSIYPSYFAIPHLKKTKGKIVVNSSSSPFLHAPRLSFYNASKAALISFYESLRVELASDITITILTPGFVESEMTTQGKHLSRNGLIEITPELVNVVISALPIMNSNACAKALVDGVCRGERYVTEPKWFKGLFILKMLCPELVELYYRKAYFTKSINSKID